MRKSQQKNQLKNQLKGMGDYDSGFPPSAVVVPPDPFPVTSSGLVTSLGGAGSWDAIWDFEESTGNLVDEIGGKTLTKNAGTASYQQTGPTASKKAVTLTGTNTGFSYDFSGGAVGTSDWACLMTVLIPTFSSSRSIATVSTFGGGTGWKHPTLWWTSGTTGLDVLHYNDAATGNETLAQTGFTTGTWHDILLVYNNGTGLRYYSSYGSTQTDTTPFVGTWPNWNQAFKIWVGASGDWGTSTILNTKVAYFAFTLDETAVDDLYTNGATRLTTFRALR